MRTDRLSPSPPRAAASRDGAQDSDMNTLGERYVRLVLAMGQHDADYVDAYYGPPEWRTEADAQKLPLAEIRRRAAALAEDDRGRGATCSAPTS